MLIELFYIGMSVVRTDGWLVGRTYGHVITKISRMGRLHVFTFRRAKRSGSDIECKYFPIGMNARKPR